MTRETVVRRLLLAVTGDAVTHPQRHVALCDRLMRDITVTRRTFDVGADMRRVIELDVRALRVAVDALPREIDALVGHRRNLLNARLVGGNGCVADQTGVDARQPGLGALGYRFVTVLGAGEPLLDVDDVRELDRL